MKKEKSQLTPEKYKGLMGKQIEIYSKNGILLNNNNKKDTLLIPAATWMNLKNMPVKKARHKRVHTVKFHLHKIVE